MITKFPQVGITGRSCYKCKCGKKVRRQKRFYQTINPWNLNKNGQPKGYAEIINDIKDEIVQWELMIPPCAHSAVVPTKDGGK